MDSYEEKYKKALSWMQGLYKGLHGKTKEEAEEAFPELKEIPKEETIKKALLRWFENYEHVYFAGIDTSDIIAWLKEQIELSVGRDLQSEIDNLSKRYPEVSFAKLSRIAVHIANWQKQQIAKDNMLLPFKEYDNLMDSINRRKRKGYEVGYKQGLVDSKDEHKPTDKIKPKFKVGDWVVYTGYLLKDSGKEIYVMQVASVEDDRYNFTDTSTLCFDSEKDMRSWTIQDAKDGDVLVSGQLTILFKKFEEYTDCNYVIAYAGIDISGKLQITDGHWLISNDSKPATKEQRNLLFQKMKEAGYEWDTEKKELRKIEQKSAYTKEYDFYGIKFIPKFAKGDIIKDKKRSEVSTIEDFSYDTGLYTHTYGQFPITIQDNYEIIEQNSAWSEEDEYYYGIIQYILNNECVGKTDKENAITWFSLLKERVQPKQEWSEEDRDYYDAIIAKLEVTQDDALLTDNQMEFLKSLKNRYTWKPSDEQMDALHYVTNFDYGGHKATLVSLYEQLKKLREELL